MEASMQVLPRDDANSSLRRVKVCLLSDCCRMDTWASVEKYTTNVAGTLYIYFVSRDLYICQEVSEIRLTLEDMQGREEQTGEQSAAINQWIMN